MSLLAAGFPFCSSHTLNWSAVTSPSCSVANALQTRRSASVFGMRECDAFGEVELGLVTGAGEAVRVASELGTGLFDDICTDAVTDRCAAPQAVMSRPTATDSEYIAHF